MMKNKLFKTSALTLCITLMVAANGCSEGNSGNRPEGERLVKITECLTEKGVNLYGAVWCSHCKKQKELFGEAANYINYVECDPRTNKETAQQCVEKGIRKIPAWEMPGGEIITGLHEPEEIAEIANCS